MFLNITLPEDIKFKSKKQEAIITSRFKRNSEKGFFKFIKTYDDGSILLHHFFKYEEKWLGYSTIIGVRGGESTNHKCFVVEGKTAKDYTLHYK